MSAFALENGEVYHTYSTYARGLDALWGAINGSIAPRRDGTSRMAHGGKGAMNMAPFKSRPLLGGWAQKEVVSKWLLGNPPT